jgi:hypothetical protein
MALSVSSWEGCIGQEERESKTSVQRWMPTLQIGVHMHFISNLLWMIHAMCMWCHKRRTAVRGEHVYSAGVVSLVCSNTCEKWVMKYKKEKYFVILCAVYLCNKATAVIADCMYDWSTHFSARSQILRKAAAGFVMSVRHPGLLIERFSWSFWYLNIFRRWVENIKSLIKNRLMGTLRDDRYTILVIYI